ncbi:MAG: 30S ribosomal protein S20 [candidate division WOR-3 bacterium]
MAKRTPSAQKQARKSQRRRLRNRKQRLALKTAVKKIAAASTKEEALKLLPEVQSVVDRSARRRIIHPKAASRLKSRVTRDLAYLK